MPASITKGTNVLAYLYDGDHRRVREERTGANAGRTIHVLHGDAAFFEQETTASGTQKYRHFISTPEGVAEVVEKTASTTSVKVMHRDHLGSTVAITDEASTDLMGFDAWRQRRSAADTGAPAATFKSDRGFTGHEHLDEVGLIHMNGRLYDPTLGRFFSADPIVQAPYNLQSYNRYSYVLNNPLSLTDPSGFSWWTRWRRPIFAIAAAAFIGGFNFTSFFSEGAMSWTAGANGLPGAIAGGFAAGGINGGNLDSAISGAFSAMLFSGAGDLGSAWGLSEGSLQKASLHAIAGCASASISGGSCGRGAASAGFAQVVGPVFQTNSFVGNLVTRSIVGAAASRIAGGRAQEGAVIAAFAYLFNECGHTHMCGSSSTKVEIQGNIAAGQVGELTAPNSIHLSISIYDGYSGVTVLDGQPRGPGWFCLVCLNSQSATVPLAGIVWGPFELAAPTGMSERAFANALITNAARYMNFLVPYSAPSIPDRAMGTWQYNSNSL